MLLLTGATGMVGSELLDGLLAEGRTVRCLVRDPRRLGARRVHVQIALGDLADPPSFRNALRGVDTVVHLAASTRDQPRGSIEELCAIATWRMVHAAQRAGAARFLLLSVLGASTHHRSRLFRAKALAEQAVRESALETTVIAPSLVYAGGDRLMALLERLSHLPAVPIPGTGDAALQPIWVDDVVSAMLTALRGDPGSIDRLAPATTPAGTSPAGTSAARARRFELAGPETLSFAGVVRAMLAAIGRPRPLLPVPTPLAARGLRLMGTAGLLGPLPV
ncbi:MAG: NAD(P)H-binding protein, partial [Acidobacteriota bacterium]|nr:NAD(P)H-binding protein [Acidobacteriota bacterium]